MIKSNLKKSLFLFLFMIFSFSLFSHSFTSSPAIQKFLKGNVQDKTVVVRESSGPEAAWVCDRAVNFVLETKRIIGEDRELDGLAIAAVLSFPQEYIRTLSDQSKNILIENFIAVFEEFSQSPNVQVTVISKMNSLSQDLRLSTFMKVLNSQLNDLKFSEMDLSVKKSIVNFLSLHGDNESFVLCFNLWNSKKYLDLNNELENAVVSLIPVSMKEASIVCSSNDPETIISFFNLIEKNKKRIFENSLCLLAENVLSNTILLVRKSQCDVGLVTGIQISCVSILGECKWTRASSVVLEYFDLARNLYTSGEFDENDFIKIIIALGNISPLDAVPVLIEYLEILNQRVERFSPVSENVALAVINTLGTIGDKSAFDALLGVTYFSYPQTILEAARNALSALRW